MTTEWRDFQEKLGGAGYVTDPDLAMAIALMGRLERPLLIEGEAGVGKTAVARALATALGADLIRLQCYEGLDANAAVYEWNYQRQLLAIKIREGEALSADEKEEHIFQDKFLLKRPLLDAISRESPPVLLIDEIDRADEEFEAYLLEILAEYQVTVPELGTIKATCRPMVILTSNGTRELSDALRRRCLYAYIEYPDRKIELAILNRRAPGLEARLARQIVGVVQALRREELEKKPGIAEMLDWAAALSGLGVNDLSSDPATVQASLVCLLKTAADRDTVPAEVLGRLIGKVA